MARSPTHRQLQVLCFITAHIDALGYSPTFREIMAEYGWRTTNAAQDVLKRLASYGLLVWDYGLKRSRSIRVTRAGREPLGLLPNQTPGELFTLTRCLRCEAAFVLGRGRCACPSETRVA